MNRKEIKGKIKELLTAGMPKSEVFSHFSGHGLRERYLAYLIASYASPRLRDEHEGKVNLLITLTFIQALFVAVLGYSIGAKIGPNAKWIVCGLLTLIPLLFAWGFYTDRVATYNLYIVLGITQLPKQFSAFSSSHSWASVIGLTVSIAAIAFVWHVRQQIFPDFVFLSPKKIHGQYVFTD